jgi:hypothetical protein
MQRIIFLIIFSISLFNKVFFSNEILKIIYEIIGNTLISILIIIILIAIEIYIIKNLIYGFKKARLSISIFLAFALIYSIYGAFYLNGKDCGCFKGILAMQHGWGLIVRNLLFLILTLDVTSLKLRIKNYS